MAHRDFLGIAAAVKKVMTITVGGTPAASHAFSVTINSKVVTYTATGAESTSTVASGLQALLAASVYPEFLEIAWSVNSNVITATSTLAGRDFDFTVTASADPTSTLTKATTTANAGPNELRTPANWSGGVFPINNDSISIRGGAIYHGLDSLSSVTLTSAELSHNAIFGLPDDVAPTDASDPLTGYPQYREKFLHLNATTVKVDVASSGNRLRLTRTAGACTLTVVATGPALSGPALEVQTEATQDHVMHFLGGSSGVAIGQGHTARAATVNMIGAGTSVRLGAGLTGPAGSPDVNSHLAALIFECALDVLTTVGGTVSRYGTGAVTSWLNIGSTTNDYGTGTVTTVYNSGQFVNRATDVKTYTDIAVYPWSRTADPLGKATVTNGITLVGCHLPFSESDPGPAPAWVQFGPNVVVVAPGAMSVPTPL